MKVEDSCDEEAVAAILACKSHYEVLGVNTDASPGEIRQTYRQLALTFHPDKNKCAGAVEAFQAIGTAYEVLSDRERKKNYDKYGQDDRQTGGRYRNYHYHHQDYQDSDEEDDNEEVSDHPRCFYARKYGR